VIEAFAWSSLGLAVLGAAFVVVLALRRVALSRRTKARREAEERLRPVALLLTEDERAELPELSVHEGHIVAGLLARYGRWLDGHSRERIAAYFERNGNVERELETLSSRRAWRRATAAFVLGDMASPAAVPALLAALSDPERDVRAAAARSLGRLDAVEAVEPLVYALVRHDVPRAVGGQALLAIGGAALPALARLTEDEEADVRALAIELTGLLGDASHASAIVGTLHDSSAEVRAKAARALGRLGAEEHTSELVAALDDRIPFVRVAAANALAAVGDRDAVPALLVRAREDPFFDAAQAAARAVGRIDAAAVAAAAREESAGRHVRESADLASLGAT
jgi:HEAT repeat protein